VATEEGERAPCAGREYMLKGGRRLSTNMGTTRKINCIFSNTAVMFCDFFFSKVQLLRTMK
jgi:hypothetical protein